MAGLEVRDGLLRESESMPVSLSLCGAYTRTLYVEDMGMRAFPVEVAAGRTLWNRVSPYLDPGSDLVLARETTDAVGLERETVLVPRVTDGFEVRFWNLAIGAEGHLGAPNSFQVQLSGLF